MKDEDLTMILARATKHIMEKTGDTFDVAVKKAKIGLKQYIRLRVDAMHELVAEGYTEDHAFNKARDLVNLGVSMEE